MDTECLALRVLEDVARHVATVASWPVLNSQEFAFLQSSEIGHSVYRKLGFRDVEEYVLLTRPLPVEDQT